jgi:hypothetical protein
MSLVAPERAVLIPQMLKNTFGGIPEVNSVEVGPVRDDNQEKYNCAVKLDLMKPGGYRPPVPAAYSRAPSEGAGCCTPPAITR